MALFEIVHFFWSYLLAWGYQHIFHFYGSVGPLEYIFMALFEIAHFSILWSLLQSLHLRGAGTADVAEFTTGELAIVEEGMGPDD